MGLMKNSSFLKIFLLFLFTGCSLNTQKKYDKLINTATDDISSVIKSITEFEIENPKHFESKIFLAEYYYAMDDYDNAENYLKRAEKVKNHAAKATKQDNLAKLYAYLARLSFIKKDYNAVVNYANTTSKYDKENHYLIDFLKGHAYVAMENDEEAIKIFDAAYAQNADKATPNDLQAYMYLLNQANRMDECKDIINKYLETGNWFYGLGQFCSGVYEKCGNIQESLFFAFMDYEYYSSMGQADDVRFVENLKNVEAALKTNGQYETAAPALNLILGLYTNVGNYSGKVSPCFISDYLIIRHKIMTHDVTQLDFNVLLGMENYLSAFPVYYWSIWETVKILDEDSLKSFLPVLKKVIALSPTSRYSDMARNEITRVFGIRITADSDLDLLLF